MILTLTNLMLCINISSYTNMVTHASAYQSKNNITHQMFQCDMYNNILILPDYLQNKPLVKDYELFIVKHRPESSEPVICNVETSNIKMYMFLVHFYETKFMKFSETTTDHADFQHQTFTIEEIDAFEENLFKKEGEEHVKPVELLDKKMNFIPNFLTFNKDP